MVIDSVFVRLLFHSQRLIKTQISYETRTVHLRP